MTATRVGVLFIVLGVAICMGSLDVIVTAHDVTRMAMALLGLGLIVAILGGIIIPQSGTGPAVETLIVIVQNAPFVERFFGRRRDDVVPPPSDNAKP